MDNRRISVRAIIIIENKLATMYREKDGRVYYTFPGGGKESGETLEECVKREVFEEFGMVVEPIQKIYVYQGIKSVEHFYLVKWISGEFGAGKGEEFQSNQDRGVYIPKLVEIAKLNNLPLMPPEIATVFYGDYLKNGEQIRKNTLNVFLG